VPLCVRDLAKSHAQVFIYLIFISLVTVIKIRLSGLGLVVGLGLIIPACRANLVLRVIWHCDVFGMTRAHIINAVGCVSDCRLHSEHR